MNNFLNRKQMHKSSRVSPPPWKDVYRKKCFERLRARRANLIEQFRFSNSPSKDHITGVTSPSKVVTDVMEIEWNALHQNRSFPSLSSSSTAVLEESDEDDAREVLEELHNELQNEDEVLLNQFLRHDSEDLRAKIEMFQEEEVICPLCKTRRLQEHRSPHQGAFCTPNKSDPTLTLGVIKCDCGLCISGQDLSLATVRSTLQAVIQDHEKGGCLTSLQFTLTQDSRGTNVLITCCSCDWMTFLL